MIKNWNAQQIISECQKIHIGATDQNLTGWVNWPCKQDLYRVKFAVDEMLKNTSTFLEEDEWLEEQRVEREQKQIWKALNDKTSNLRSRRN